MPTQRCLCPPPAPSAPSWRPQSRCSVSAAAPVPLAMPAPPAPAAPLQALRDACGFHADRPGAGDSLAARPDLTMRWRQPPVRGIALHCKQLTVERGAERSQSAGSPVRPGRWRLEPAPSSWPWPASRSAPLTPCWSAAASLPTTGTALAGRFGAFCRCHPRP